MAGAGGTLENILVRKCQIRRCRARKLERLARKNLGLACSKTVVWSAELEAECLRIHEEEGYAHKKKKESDNSSVAESLPELSCNADELQKNVSSKPKEKSTAKLEMLPVATKKKTKKTKKKKKKRSRSSKKKEEWSQRPIDDFLNDLVGTNRMIEIVSDHAHGPGPIRKSYVIPSDSYIATVDDDKNEEDLPTTSVHSDRGYDSTDTDCAVGAPHMELDVANWEAISRNPSRLTLQHMRPTLETSEGLNSKIAPKFPMRSNSMEDDDSNASRQPNSPTGSLRKSKRQRRVETEQKVD